MIALCLLWLGGFAAFLLLLPKLHTGTPEKADGIIVLTGGPGRVNAGARLLREGFAPNLLISGVHPSVRPRVLRRQLSLSENLMACCVSLDKMSRNTRMNARRSRIWLDQTQAKSILLVSGRDHLPRGRILLQDAAPDVRFISYAVGGNMSLLARFAEYNKFLITWTQAQLNLL